MASTDCAGCLSKLSDSTFLKCCRCAGKYHTTCVNCSQKDYDAMTQQHKSNWVCVLCLSKERKGKDNSNTPVRASQTFSQPDPEHITKRTKARPAAGKATASSASATLSAEITARGNAASNASTVASPVVEVNSCPCLSAQNIRDIIREELQNTFKHQVGPQFADVHKAITSLEASFSFFSEELEKIKTEHDTQSKLLQTIIREKDALSADNRILSERLAKLDQLSRSSNVEIQCVPENKQENILNTIQQLGKVVKCPISDANIHYCSRLAKMNAASPRPRSILVKFSSPRLRDEFLAATIKFNKLNRNEKLNTSHLGIGGDSKKAIYVVEHLAPEIKSLHAAARSKAKELNYKFVWVRDGRVFMRKNEESKHVHITNLDMLMKLS